MAAITLEQVQQAIAAATTPMQPIKMTVGQLKTLVGRTPSPPLAMVLEAHGAAPKLVIYPAAVNFRPDLDETDTDAAPATEPAAATGKPWDQAAES